MADLKIEYGRVHREAVKAGAAGRNKNVQSAAKPSYISLTLVPKELRDLFGKKEAKKSTTSSSSTSKKSASKSGKSSTGMTEPPKSPLAKKKLKIGWDRWEEFKRGLT